MSDSQNPSTDLGLEYSVANAVATTGESIRLELTEMLNNTPNFFAHELEPFEPGCTDEKLAEFLLAFSKICTQIAQLELELKIQQGKAEISKLVNLAVSEVGMDDMEFTIIADENDDDDEYVSERATDLMNMPINEWAYLGGYILELKEEISRTICSD